MDLSKLSTGDKVLGGSGIALFIFSFLPWFGKDYSTGLGGTISITGNAWDIGFFTGTLPVILGIFLVAYVVVTKLLDGIELPELPVGYPLVVLGVAGLAALLVVLRLLVGYSQGYGGLSVDLDRKYGLVLAALAAIGLAGGAFLKFQEDGGELPTKKASGTGDSGTPTPF